MGTKSDPARISFAVGCVVFVLGEFMLCFCPWMFAITAIAFGISAATAQKPALRWMAVVLIAVSVATAINQAANRQQALDAAIEAGRRNDALLKSRTNGSMESEYSGK